MPGYGMKPRMMEKGGAAKKSAKKQKRMVPASPPPMERPDELFDSAGAGAVDRGNRAAARLAKEYDSLMGIRGYAMGGEVERVGGVREVPTPSLMQAKTPDYVVGYKEGGAVCRGGGAALRGTKFRGVK